MDENTPTGKGEAKKTHSNSDSGSSSLITSSKASPFCGGVLLATFSAMFARAFSRRESRYSCDTSSSSSSSELSVPDSEADSDSDSEDEEREDVDEPEEDSARSSESAGYNLPFPFCDTESAIGCDGLLRRD